MGSFAPGICRHYSIRRQKQRHFSWVSLPCAIILSSLAINFRPFGFPSSNPHAAGSDSSSNSQMGQGRETRRACPGGRRRGLYGSSMTTTLHPDIDRVLIDADTIQHRVRELAAQIDRDYAGSSRLLLVGVLKGAFIFMADLCRALTIPHAVDFMAVSSYGMTAPPAAQCGSSWTCASLSTASM